MSRFLPHSLSQSLTLSATLFFSSFLLLRLLQWHSLPCSDLINHIQTALCCFLSFHVSPSPFTSSNCLLFSLPVFRRKCFSLSNNRRQILMQCIHLTTDGFYTCRLYLAQRYSFTYAKMSSESRKWLSLNVLCTTYLFVYHCLNRTFLWDLSLTMHFITII